MPLVVHRPSVIRQGGLLSPRFVNRLLRNFITENPTLSLGGTYQLPMQEYAAPFWLSLLEELKNQTGEVFGFVALSYCEIVKFD